MNLFTKLELTHRSRNPTYVYHKGNMGGNNKLADCD